MSPGVQRARTAHCAARRRVYFGEHHPATWAAYARLHVAWGGWRGMPDGRAPVFSGVTALSCAYTRADLRARGLAAFENRHERKRLRRRALVK